MKEDRKIQFRKRDTYNFYVKVIHTELANRLHSLEFDVLDSSTRLKVNSIVHKKFLRQRKKLSLLLPRQHTQKIQNFSDHKFFERFVDLSNSNFSNQETKLLSKGFKHNVQHKKSRKDYELLGIEAELAFRHLPNQHFIKHDTKNLIKNGYFSQFERPSFDHQLLTSIRQKSIKNDIIFTKADKGHTVISLKKDDYIKKTLDFLSAGNYIMIKNDPTNKFLEKLKITVRECDSIFGDIGKRKIIPTNPQPPRLYSLIKLHKSGNPIRPVVSFISAPSYLVSQYLINIIKTYTGFVAKYSIKNSFELVSKIKDVYLPNNAKFISFDVSNLFPSIPPKDTLLIVKDLLIKKNVNIIIQDHILQMLEVCLEQNYFLFNDKYYYSENGLIMGNPLSPLLAEIFMNNLEEKIYSHPISKQFLYYFRYVDDILVCFKGTDRQLSTLQQFLNTLHPNITFTTELEENNSLNFLDLTLTKDNNKHIFSIFHKPSQTDITIHNTSFHPYQQKMLAYSSMIHRLINIPLPPAEFKKELSIIKQIAINNGYDYKMVNDILNKKHYKTALSEIYPHTKDIKNKFCSITYFGNTSIKVKNCLKKQDCIVAFRTNNNLSKHILNNKPTQNKMKQSGVYELSCKGCHKKYVGRTCRNFSKRLKEHKRSYINHQTDSSYANHLLSENHGFNDELKILHKETNFHKLCLLEYLEINKGKISGNLLNDQIECHSSPLLNLFTQD